MGYKAQHKILCRRETIRPWERWPSVPFNMSHRSYNYRNGIYIPFHAFDKFYKYPKTAHKLYWKNHYKGYE